MEWIRKHRNERKRKRLATRKSSLRNAQFQLDAEQARFESAVTPAPTGFFSVRRKRSASAGLTRYDLLEQTGEEPDYPSQAVVEPREGGLGYLIQSMELEDGEGISRNTFATLSPSPQLLPTDSVSSAGRPQSPTPEAEDASAQNWLERVSSTFCRKPTIKALEAYKSGGIRSAWACTLPRNWKSRNAAAAKALANSAAGLDNFQLPRSMDDMDLGDERRSPLPSHWRDGAESRQIYTKKTSEIAGCDSEVGDWNSPRESEDGDAQEDRVTEVDQEFRDWMNHNRVLVEQYDPLAGASKRASILSEKPKSEVQ